MKLLALFLTMLCVASSSWCLELTDLKGAKVNYASGREFKNFPIPTIGFRRPGLVTEERRAEVIAKIVSPIIRETPFPVAAVIIEFFPNHINEYVGLEVLSSHHPMSSGLVYFDKDGRITDDLYKRWFDGENDQGEDRN